jgi:hypothetical protein
MSEGLASATANGKGATATVTWCGCYRGFFEGYEVRCEDAIVRLPPPIGLPVDGLGVGVEGNAANPMTGSGMQQARNLRAEETVEVVRNHEDGT